MSQSLLNNVTLNKAPEPYLIEKATAGHPEALANITDLDTVTVIAHEKAIKEPSPDASLGWQLYTMESTLAEEEAIIAELEPLFHAAGLKVLPLVAFAKLHFLVGRGSVQGAEHIFRSLGATIR